MTVDHQMKRKYVSKIFVMISNWKKTFVSMVDTKIIQRCKGEYRKFSAHFSLTL